MMPQVSELNGAMTYAPSPAGGQSIPQSAYVSGGVGRRVAIYDSRTGYIVKVEQAPDWDDVTKHKMDEATLWAILPVLKALGVKIKNNSEDDFDEGGDADAAQSGQGGQRVAPSVAARAARSAEAITAGWSELLPGTTPPSLESAAATGGLGPDPERSETGSGDGGGNGETG